MSAIQSIFIMFKSQRLKIVHLLQIDATTLLQGNAKRYGMFGRNCGMIYRNVILELLYW